MNTLGQQLKAYSKANYTTPKTQQIVMLYDGAIRSLQHAREAMEKNDIETRFHKLTNAGDIIHGLQSSLDFEAGGQMAGVLYDFYATLSGHLFSLHQQPDIGVLDHVISELREMRAVWAAIHAGGTGDDGQVAARAPDTPDSLEGAVVSA